MPDSSPAPTAPAALEEPDIGRVDGPVLDARLLFCDPDGGEVSNLTEASVVGGRVCEGKVPVVESGSVRSAARFDIGDENVKGEEDIDMEEREIQKAGESLVVARQSSKRAGSRVDWLKIAAFDEAGVKIGTKILTISFTSMFMSPSSRRADKPCLHIHLLRSPGRKKSLLQHRVKDGGPAMRLGGERQRTESSVDHSYNKRRSCAR